MWVFCHRLGFACVFVCIDFAPISPLRSLYSSLLHLTPLLFSLRPTSDHLYESDDDSEDGAEEQQPPPHAAPPAVAAAAVESNGDSVALAPQNLKTV